MGQNLLINDEFIMEFTHLVEFADRIVVTCHFSPDGDAMGSSLAMSRILKNMGKKAVVVVADTPPKYLSWMPGFEDIIIYSRCPEAVGKSFNQSDLIICLDFNEPKRVDHMEALLLASPARKVMIDHHLQPDDFADVIISHPEYSSTCLLLYSVIKASPLYKFIDKEVAVCIYTGMMTDTGNFSYNSHDPKIYTVISELISLGIDKDEIYRAVYFTNTVNRLRLNGFALYERLTVFEDHRAALIWLSREDLNRFEYRKGDTEDLVNRPLTIPNVVYSVFLREEQNYIKVSARSKGEFPVNKLCFENFGGGGHLNAAGGEFHGSLEEAIDKFKCLIADYDKYL